MEEHSTVIPAPELPDEAEYPSEVTESYELLSHHMEEAIASLGNEYGFELEIE